MGAVQTSWGRPRRRGSPPSQQGRSQGRSWVAALAARKGGEGEQAGRGRGVGWGPSKQLQVVVSAVLVGCGRGRPSDGGHSDDNGKGGGGEASGLTGRQRSGGSGKVSNPETFQTIRKLSRLFGNFPDNLETFQIIRKLSRQSVTFPDNL